MERLEVERVLRAGVVGDQDLPISEWSLEGVAAVPLDVGEQLRFGYSPKTLGEAPRANEVAARAGGIEIVGRAVGFDPV